MLSESHPEAQRLSASRTRDSRTTRSSGRRTPPADDRLCPRECLEELGSRKVLGRTLDSEIRDAVAGEHECLVTLLNYHGTDRLLEGTAGSISAGALRDRALGEVLHVGVQVDASVGRSQRRRRGSGFWVKLTGGWGALVFGVARRPRAKTPWRSCGAWGASLTAGCWPWAGRVFSRRACAARLSARAFGAGASAPPSPALKGAQVPGSEFT